jgi:membrane associated rhomboid family serine protease
VGNGLVQDGTRALQGAKAHAATLLSIVGLLWLVQVANVLLGGALLVFGIHPRTLPGLVGLLFAPFLHGSMTHLLLNTVSFVVLGALMRFRHRNDFVVVAGVGALTSGLGAWLLGAPGSVHIGASGVIFAFLGFLMARGIFERSVSSVLLSVFVTWFFGSMVWGIVPVMGAAISWQAHLFGLLGGILCAYVLGGEIRRRRGGRRR